MKQNILTITSIVSIGLLTLTQSITFDPKTESAFASENNVSNYSTMEVQTLEISPYTKNIVLSRDGYTATSEEALAAMKAAEEAAKEAVRKAEEDRIALEAANKDTSDAGYTVPNFTPNPGSAQSYAQGATQKRGWGQTEFNCLVALWSKESGWRANALNASSGAYGIPQALPGNKMTSAGVDWETNQNTQIEWGLGYIAARYGTPCTAWQHSVDNNWY